MKIIEPSVEILNPPDYQQMLNHIEIAARTCYKSEDKIKDGSAEELIKRLIKMNHLSVLEHVSISVRFICDRGVSHEVVRHRLCSFSQESTRYCNYSNSKYGSELTFIIPPWVNRDLIELNYNDIKPKIGINKADIWWMTQMRDSEDTYIFLMGQEWTPQEARSVLPNSLKTDIVVTANIREWRTIFEQRCASAAHPQMRQATIPLLGKFISDYKVFFEDMFDIHIDGMTHFANKGWNLAEVK